MIREGRQAGLFHAVEHDIVQRVFQVGTLNVRDIMIPRHDVIWLDVDDSHEQNLRTIRENDFTYFPVARGDLDHLIGVLHVKDLLNARLLKDEIDFTALARRPVILPETISARELLEYFMSSPVHMAMVVDEYGVIQGIVTVSDILGAIVGNIPSLTPPPEIFRREDGSWLVDGNLSIEKLKDFFHLDELPGEAEELFHTLAGFLMTCLERLPAVGDRLQWQGYIFEVVDMDGSRVDKVLVRTVAETAGGGQGDTQ